VRAAIAYAKHDAFGLPNSKRTVGVLSDENLPRQPVDGLDVFECL